MSTTEFQDLSSQLEESTAVLCILEKLVKVHDALQNIDKALTSEEYTSATDSISLIEDLLDKPLNEREGEINILNTLKDSYCVQKEKLISFVTSSHLSL